jgi:hypothetical protein
MSELDKYITAEAVEAELGCSRRAVWRLIARAEAAGHKVSEMIFGRRVILKKALPTLAGLYYPVGSENRSAAAKAWGHQGGTAKAANLAAAARGGRRRGAKSGTAGTGA